MFQEISTIIKRVEFLKSYSVSTLVNFEKVLNTLDIVSLIDTTPIPSSPKKLEVKLPASEFRQKRSVEKENYQLLEKPKRSFKLKNQSSSPVSRKKGILPPIKAPL